MLTGRPPFKGASPTETIRQVIDDEPVPPRRLQPRVPRDLETICLKCLNKATPKRYARAVELADDLDRYLAGQPIRARRTPPWERGLKWIRRHPAAAMLWGLGLTTALSLGVAGTWWDAQRRDQQRREDTRVAGLAVVLGRELGEGEALVERGDWGQAQLVLTNLQTQLRQEPRLGDLHARTSALLAQTEGALQRQQERQGVAERWQQFRRGRDEAFFRDAGIAADPAANLAAARAAAQAALAIFGDGLPGEGWSLRPPAEDWPEPPRDELRDHAYELLLVLAGATAQALAGEEPRTQAAQALKVLDDAARLHPEPTRAYHLRREACLLPLGETAAAREAREAAAALEPASAFDHFLSGQERYKRNDRVAAIRHFDAALRLQPDHFWSHALLAIVYLQESRPTEAKAHLNACLNHQSELLWLYLLRGFAFGEAGAISLAQAELLPTQAEQHREEAARQFANAEADYRKALALRPEAEDHYILLVNRGVMRFRRHDLDAAAADLQAAIRLRPELYQAYVSLAQVHQRQGDTDQAVTRMSQAIALSPRRAELYRNRALIQRERASLTASQRAAALADLERAIALEAPGDLRVAENRLNQGTLLYHAGQHEAARRACQEALAVNPRLVEAHWLHVLSLLALKRYDEVLPACDAVVQHGKSSAELYEVRGLARAGRRDFAGAIEDYTQALALRPQAAQLYAHRGWAYLFCDVPSLALRDFEKALALEPDHAEALGGRGFARVVLGHHRDAVHDAETAVRLASDDPRTLYQAARIYVQAAEWSAQQINFIDGADALRRYRDYRKRAGTLLQQVLALLPEEERAAFRRDVLLTDPALQPLYRARPIPAPLPARDLAPSPLDPPASGPGLSEPATSPTSSPRDGSSMPPWRG